MESSKYIDVESEYKQFVEDFISFLKEQSEKYNKPTLSEKYDYLGNKFAISDFISTLDAIPISTISPSNGQMLLLL